MDDDGTWDDIDNGDFEETMETPEDMLHRVEQMIADDGGTWDLSPNDKTALRHVMSGYIAMLQTKDRLGKIVCTEGDDKGVVLLSSDGPTKHDPKVNGQVYIHEHFSPLGDALIEAFENCVAESR
jgi:hypothetical protein